MPSLKEIIASLSPDVLAKAAPHLEKLENWRRQSQRDVEIAKSVIRILQHPGHQRLADELRNLVRYAV
jgi:hypothetical protein